MRSLPRQFGLAVALALGTLGAARADAGEEPRAQMLTLRYEFGAGQQQFLANGVPLTAPPVAARADGKQGSDWGSNLGTVIVAAGVALAVVVLVSGHVADDLNDKEDKCVPGTPGC